MTAVLCSSPRCRPPGRHLDGCAGDQCPLPRRHGQDCQGKTHCRGCAPAKAADGLNLCPYCTRRIGRDAVEAARLWYEIGWVLNGQGANGTVVVSNPHPGLNVNPRAVSMRTDIRHTLVGWTTLIAQERGFSLPGHWHRDPILIALPPGVEGPLWRDWDSRWVVDESQHALGAYIANSAHWLAGGDLAASAAEELRDLRARAWGAAYPEGASIVEIGSCPETTADGEPCTGTVRAVLREADSKLPNKVVCDADSTHVWPAERWRTLGRAMGKLLAGYTEADVIAAAYGKPLGTIYWLASRDKWRSIRRGRRSLYDALDVARTLEGTTA